ncbi:MAG: Yip1 family protein [Caldimonas sp.]
MSLIDRVQAILLKPKLTWPVIAAEPGDVSSIFSTYVVILAAIPALAGFIGMTVFGFGGFGITVRVPIVAGLVNLIVGYLLSLVMVYVLSLVVNALAPTFGGTKNPVAALKVVAYSMTAVWVAGILSLLPALAILGGLIGIGWTIYLLYTGLPVLMRTPADKAGAYTAVTIVCGIIAGLIVGVISSMFITGGSMGMHGIGATGNSTFGGDVVIKGADGTAVTLNGGAMTDLAKRMEEAGKRMETAQKSGDQAAAGKAMGDMLGAVTGSGSTVPIASADLKSMLPETLDDMPRTGIEAQSGQAMGMGGSSAKATYAAGERRVELSITDTGGLAGLATMAGWANMTMDRDADGQIEKVYKDGPRTVREQYRKDGSRGEMTVILGNGVIVEADGTRVDIGALKKVVASIDVGRIEAMKRAAR